MMFVYGSEIYLKLKKHHLNRKKIKGSGGAEECFGDVGCNKGR